MEALCLDRADGIVTVTLNRPEKKNAINMSMWDELISVLEEVAKRSEDRVLVLTGAGGEFCSGADLSDESGGGKHQLELMHHFNRVGMMLHQLPKPAIAKVRGIAAGAGLNIGLGCDLVVASENARFCEIFARRGLSLDLGGSWLLPRLVGMQKAKELAMLAEIIPAEEALRIGLINRVVPDDELDAFVDDWAGRLAAGPPLALRLSKRLLNQSFAVGMDEALDAEAIAQSVNVSSEDVREAFAAFFQKRQPVFKGR